MKTITTVIGVVVLIVLLIGLVWWLPRQGDDTEKRVDDTQSAGTTCSLADIEAGNACQVGGRTVTLEEVRQALAHAELAVPEFAGTRVTLSDFEAPFAHEAVEGRVFIMPEHIAVAAAKDGETANVYTHLVVDAGGSGSFSYLALFSYQPEHEELLFLDAVLLGDRIAIEALRANLPYGARVELLVREEGAAMAEAPTDPRTQVFTVRGGTLVGAELREDMIVLTNPAPGTVINSPLSIEGRARGGWFFEATFPVVLTNWDGLIIAEGYAEAQDDWMTEEFVPFKAELTFAQPDYGERGTLILKKANASGLPEHDDALEITIFFTHEEGDKG